MGATIHDHFDGSANCVECGGPCQLDGSDLLATQLLRIGFEYAALSGSIPPMIYEFVLEHADIDWRPLWKRAVETTPPNPS
jgi:hypothetical protein